MNDNQEMLARELTLESLRRVSVHRVSARLLERSISVQAFWDSIAQHMVLRLEAEVFCQRLDEQVVRYPADWWEAVKERFAPRWFVRRWPVRYAERRMRLYAWYPDVLPEKAYRPIVQIMPGGGPPA